MSDRYRVLITGSRTWDNRPVIEMPLHQIANERGWKGFVVVHGDCPMGADAIAKQWAKDHGVRHEPHPADWKRYGKRAGFVRNNAMVDLGADECLAYINRCVKVDCRIGKVGRKVGVLHGSHGATETADVAESWGIPTRRWTNLRLPAFARQELIGNLEDV